MSGSFALKALLFVLIVFISSILFIEFGSPILNRAYGPQIEDYCKKDRMIKVYDVALFEQRKKEIDDVDVPVSADWKTEINFNNIDSFLMEYVGVTSYLLTKDGKNVVRATNYSLNFRNITSIIGLSPDSSHDSCQGLGVDYFDQYSKYAYTSAAEGQSKVTVKDLR